MVRRNCGSTPNDPGAFLALFTKRSDAFGSAAQLWRTNDLLLMPHLDHTDPVIQEARKVVSNAMFHFRRWVEEQYNAVAVPNLNGPIAELVVKLPTGKPQEVQVKGTVQPDGNILVWSPEFRDPRAIGQNDLLFCGPVNADTVYMSMRTWFMGMMAR